MSMNKHTHISSIALFFILAVAFSSCVLGHPSNIPPYAAEKTDVNAGFTAAAITNLKLDGCSWMLVLENGKKLEPAGIRAAFLQEGLKVWVKYIPRDGMSICMSGQMVTVTEIKL